MLHTFMPDNVVKLRFSSIFDDLNVAVITHDLNAKTLRLGPGYSILDENGDPLGSGGGGVTIAQNQIAYATAANVLGGDAGFTFDPAGGVLNVGSDGLIFQPLGVGAFFGVLSIFGYSTPAVTSLLNIEGDYAGTAGSQSPFNGIAVDVGLTGAVTVAELSAIRISSNYKTAGTVTDNFGLLISDQSIGANNYAIKTGAGDIVFGTLAGIGTRTVVVDANGKLSAP